MRKDNDALAQRKSTVENKVTEEAVETEVNPSGISISIFLPSLILFLLFFYFYLLTLVNKTPVIFITSFAYRATLFALSVVPLKLIAKS
jgi:hypothetical protein